LSTSDGLSSCRKRQRKEEENEVASFEREHNVLETFGK
jgi:hypothetical protein